MSHTLTAADLETLAKRYGMSVTQLCRISGVARAAFYKWRGGKVVPSLTTYDKLLTAIADAKEANEARE
jgi:predicted transcriptional regulator